jgi:parallel beta-helix repeat protein
MRKFLILLLALTLVVALNACISTENGSEGSQEENRASSTNITTSGWVEKDEVWEGEILLTGDVVIPAGISIKIKPGTTIRTTAKSDDQDSPEQHDQQPKDFDQEVATPLISIVVFGALDVQGTSSAPILFTSDSSSPTNVDWQGIMIEGDGSVQLTYATIEYSKFGIQLVSGNLSLSVSHATFRDIKICAICADGASPLMNEVEISFSNFIRCDREAIDTYSEQPIIVHHNVFTENHVGIMSVGSTIIIENNRFIDNERGIGVVDGGAPFISGNAFDYNQDAAIFITGASPIITNNNFNNNELNLQMEESANNLTAKNNWWGSSDIQVIGNLIVDGMDDSNLGIIDFQPYANNPLNLDVPDY